MAPSPGDYRPPPWLPGGHLQTIWPLLCKGPRPPLQRAGRLICQHDRRPNGLTVLTQKP